MTTFPGGIVLGAVCSALSLLTSIAAPAQARTIYVRQTGNDSSDGTAPSSAVRTIGQGAELAVANDTVLVGPGTYFEGNLRPPDSGRVRFLADRLGEGVGDPPGDVVIDASGFTSGFEINDQLAVTIDGFVINGPSIGIYVKSGSHGGVVSNNIVSDNLSSGIYVQDSRDVMVFNNLVYNNQRTGILITSSRGGGGSSGARVINNTVYRNANRGIFFSGDDAFSDGLVLNNIVEKNGLAGIQVNEDQRQGYLSAGNVLFDNDGNDFGSNRTPSDVTDRQNTAPLFIDPDGADNALGGIHYADDDFRLQQKRAGQAATSPAVDAGSDLSRRLNLLRSTTRSDGKRDRGIVDAGYHYNNFSPPPATPEERIRPKKLYVSQANGNDANDGATRETAVQTLKQAFRMAEPGHLIAVIGGTYAEGTLNPPSGIPGRPIVIKAIGGARIDGLPGLSGLSLSGVSYLTLDALHVTGAGESGIDVRPDSSNIILRRCRLTSNVGRGLSVRESTAVQVVASVFEGNGRGIQVDDSVVSIERSSIRDSTASGLWAFNGSAVTVSKTDFIGNDADGILAEQSEVSVAGGTITGNPEGGARFRKGSTGSLEDVTIFDNGDVGIQVISSFVGLTRGTIRGSLIGVQSFVDPVSQLPVALTIHGTRICENDFAGVDAEATVIAGVDAELCANGHEGLHQRGGTADLVGIKARANQRIGISVSDTTRVAIRQAIVSDNHSNGIQLVHAGDVDIHDSRMYDNNGDGLTILDTEGADVVNNLVYGNDSSGVLLSGNSIGSSDAFVAYNTFYDNANRGLFIRDIPNQLGSTHAVVTGNIFQMNGNAGVQVNTLSLVGYDGDFNLNVDPYGGNTPVGENDIIFGAPLFVAPESGDFHLSQTAAGQGSTSPAVNAGSTTAAASGMATKTTRTDRIADSGVVDLGYHYLP